jgi:hypothetical protein
MHPPADSLAPPGGAPNPTGKLVNIAPRSWATIGFYLVLAGILVLVQRAYGSGNFLFPSFPLVLAVVLLFFLARYASTHYVLTPEELRARRLAGSRTVRLEEIRSIERANLRDLGPVGLIGTWGWRGRVWSPVIGSFDTCHTVSEGLLVSAGRVPLFISPRDPVAFARELSRRARSWGVDLPADPGSVAARAEFR